jgi:hypothetical protein
VDVAGTAIDRFTGQQHQRCYPDSA